MRSFFSVGSPTCVLDIFYNGTVLRAHVDQFDSFIYEYPTSLQMPCRTRGEEYQGYWAISVMGTTMARSRRDFTSSQSRGLCKNSALNSREENT